MKPFVIFVIILTVLYVIYYAVTVARDLYGAKGQKKSDEEEIDVGGLDEEKGTSVVEKDGGFEIGEGENMKSYTDGPEEPDKDAKPRESPVDRINSKVSGKMEETQVTFSDPMNSLELHKLMLKRQTGTRKRSDVTIKPAIDEI